MGGQGGGGGCLMLTCHITVAVMKIFLILTGQNVAVHLVTCDSGLVSVLVLVAEDRGLVGAVTSDQGWCRDSRGLVGAGDLDGDSRYILA